MSTDLDALAKRIVQGVLDTYGDNIVIEETRDGDELVVIESVWERDMTEFIQGVLEEALDVD